MPVVIDRGQNGCRSGSWRPSSAGCWQRPGFSPDLSGRDGCARESIHGWRRRHERGVSVSARSSGKSHPTLTRRHLRQHPAIRDRKVPVRRTEGTAFIVARTIRLSFQAERQSGKQTYAGHLHLVLDQLDLPVPILTVQKANSREYLRAARLHRHRLRFGSFPMSSR